MPIPPPHEAVPRWESALENLAKQHLLRTLSPIHSPSGPRISLNGKEILLLASNNYLGLANHPQLKEAAIRAIEEFGVGAGASRLVSGNLTPHEELERALALFTETEKTLSFSSGYMANLGVIPGLAPPESLILADRLCHASLIDACRLSGAKFRVFPHNDTDALTRLLQQRSSHRPTLIVTEGVFSMDGDLAPLPELTRLAEEFQASLLIDDAHGTGILGPNGRGTLEHFQVHSPCCFHMGTLSKALGSSGGFIAGPRSFVDYLINTSRSFMYTTAPPPASVAAATVALNIVQQEPQRRARLWENRNFLYTRLKEMGFHLTETQSPILPIILHDPELAVEMSDRLRQTGVYAPAIRPPTVQRGTSRLRLTVTAEHTPDNLRFALQAIHQVGTSLKVI